MPSAVQSLGFIDRIDLKGNKLELEGCVGSFNAGLVDGFRIEVAGLPAVEALVEVGLPKSVEDRGWSSLQGATNAGFRVRAKLSPKQLGPDGLVILTPTFKGRGGTPLMCAVNSSLPLPPEEYQTGIGGYFLPVAFEFLAHCLEYGLTSESAVLDAGCGVGRMAFSLMPYMGTGGRYEGFDIVEKWTTWAQSEIHSRYPNFNFRMVDIRNDHYNPNGSIDGPKFVFPYADNSFDFAIATSLFTHLRADVANAYLHQIARVLKPGGRCLSTWFILTEETKRLVATKQTSHEFVHALEDCFTSRPDAPEYAIAFDDALLRKWLADCGLRVRTLLPGLWCWRTPFTSFQDIVVLEKTADRRAANDHEGS